MQKKIFFRFAAESTCTGMKVQVVMTFSSTNFVSASPECRFLQQHTRIRRFFPWLLSQNLQVCVCVLWHLSQELLLLCRLQTRSALAEPIARNVPDCPPCFLYLQGKCPVFQPAIYVGLGTAHARKSLFSALSFSVQKRKVQRTMPEKAKTRRVKICTRRMPES